jgi:hypothetical protein
MQRCGEGVAGAGWDAGRAWRAGHPLVHGRPHHPHTAPATHTSQLFSLNAITIPCRPCLLAPPPHSLPPFNPPTHHLTSWLRILGQYSTEFFATGRSHCMPSPLDQAHDHTIRHRHPGTPHYITHSATGLPRQHNGVSTSGQRKHRVSAAAASRELLSRSSTIRRTHGLFSCLISLTPS